MLSAPVGFIRGTRQFSVFLQRVAGKIDSPIGRGIHITPNPRAARATQTFEKEETYTVAGALH